jgi:hypothetical protein
VGQAFATEAVAECVRSGDVREAESNIKLLGLVSTPAAADWDASVTVEQIDLIRPPRLPSQHIEKPACFLVCEKKQKMIFDVCVFCRCQKVTLKSFLYVPMEQAPIPTPS